MPRKPSDVSIRTFRAGEVIFREGDPPRDEAYMVHLGRVEVRKQVGGEPRVLRVMVKGELLGELGLFGKSRRSATAVAIIRDLSLKLLATNELLVAEGRRGQTRSAGETVTS